MKKLYKLIKGMILFTIILLSFIFIYFFFYFKQIYRWDSIHLKINFMSNIIFFIIIFFILSILIDFKYYNIIFSFIITLGTFFWIINYLIEIFKVEIGLWIWSTIADFAIILCFSILTPGFTLNIIRFIKNNSNEKRKKTFFKKFHFHEGFVGILFITFSFFLWVIRFLLIQNEIMKRKLRIFLAIDMIFLFFFSFSGSFLIFRDRRDIIKLKFIEKRTLNKYNYISSLFGRINLDSLQFFRSPRFLLYPIGIFLGSISLNMFIHGTDFLIEEIFNLPHERIVFIGLILCFIAGGFIGVDWYRLFAKLYPKLYFEIEKILEELKELKKYK